MRAGYMYSGMADVAALTNPSTSKRSRGSGVVEVDGNSIWAASVPGAEARRSGRLRTPNKTAYNETCAAIANMLWNRPLFCSAAIPKSIVFERTLQWILSGVSLTGDLFFINPWWTPTSAVRGSVFVLPLNMARFIPPSPGMCTPKRQLVA